MATQRTQNSSPVKTASLDSVLQLWMIPIYLRSKAQYDEETERRTVTLLKKYGETSKDLYASRTEFDRSDSVRDVRSREHPLPWRFSDIIGWIDVTAFLRGKRIQVGLFLPKNRISRQLKQKKYVIQAHKHVPYSDCSTNEELRKRIICVVREFATVASGQGLHVDLSVWEHLIAHTNLVGMIRSVTDDALNV